MEGRAEAVRKVVSFLEQDMDFLDTLNYNFN